jgi:DNA-binding transcriptional ArsR family regulator
MSMSASGRDRLAFGEQQDQRFAVRVANRVQLGVQAALCPPDTTGDPPFFKEAGRCSVGFQMRGIDHDRASCLAHGGERGEDPLEDARLAHGLRDNGILKVMNDRIDMQVFTCILCSHRRVRPMHADKVFKALGDPTRRKLLDLLCEKNGQTLGQLCENLDMARQSATQHLGILEAANLVSTVRRGREKLHFINPVPLHEVYERWVRKFERQRLSLLHDLKKELEGE